MITEGVKKWREEYCQGKIKQELEDKPFQGEVRHVMIDFWWTFPSDRFHVDENDKGIKWSY